MKGVLILSLLLFLPISLLAQAKTDQDIDVAYQNAKKGIYWALSNIPGKKATMDNDLIAEDKLVCFCKTQ